MKCRFESDRRYQQDKPNHLMGLVYIDQFTNFNGERG